MIKLKKFSKVGIIGYGAYVPKFRISVDVIAKTWDKNGAVISASLGVRQKSVAGMDEDCLTMATQAGWQALQMAKIDPRKIGACFVGSESFPYAVKPTSTVLAEALGIGNDYFSADLQFACKAGTAGVQIVASMIEAGLIDYGLAVGADKSQSKPNDALEFTAASAAGALILGNNKKDWLASLDYISSLSSDTPDFWRRSTQEYPSHAGRFTGGPAYFKHVVGATKLFLAKINKSPKDFDYAVFHSPNKKFPVKAGKILGFTSEQLEYSLLVENIGNPYSASSMVSLANVLDNSRKNAKILVTSYGSGAGSDSFSFTRLSGQAKQKLTDYLKNAQELDYGQYLRFMGVVR